MDILLGYFKMLLQQQCLCSVDWDGKITVSGQ